jgi:hypothetical protein
MLSRVRKKLLSGEPELKIRLGFARIHTSLAQQGQFAQAQRARWARARNGSQRIAVAKTVDPAPVKRSMSAAARRKIAAFQRARWAKIKTQQKKSA